MRQERADAVVAVSGVCLLVTDVDAPSGGIQKNSRILLKELNARGIKTYALVRNYHHRPRRELSDGTYFYRSPVIGRGLAINGALYFVSAVWWLIRHRRRYDVVHCQQMFGPTMAATVASFITGRPVLTRVTAIGELGETRQIREMPLAALRLRLIGRVKRWAALTREMKRELEEIGVAPGRISIIHNSTELPADAPPTTERRRILREELGLARGKLAIFVGRLSEEKNLDVLIEAWRALRTDFPDAQLLLLGEGGAYRNAEPRLRKLVANHYLEQSVRFLGHVDRAKDYVMAADVFVLPSRTEGMSNALVEAFACGAAVVATDIPGNTEICADRDNALLVPVGDAGALAAAIGELFRSPELAARLGLAARRKAEAELSVDGMVTGYLRAYSEMLAA